MRKIGALILWLTTTPVSAEQLLGLWITEQRRGAFAHVLMEPCEDKICGTVIKSFENGTEVESASLGKVIVYDMTAGGKHTYAGRVWNPNNDKTYLAKLRVDGDTLALRGCVAGGLFCAKRTWTRIKAGKP